MARPTAQGITKPSDDVVAQEGDNEVATAEGDELANLEGYTGPDGSKSLGYLKNPPGADSSGLGVNADDAGRTHQEPGQNSGAGSPQNVSTKDEIAAARQSSQK